MTAMRDGPASDNTRNRDTSLPEAISHRQLAELLPSALKDRPLRTPDPASLQPGQEPTEDLLERWTSLSRELLETIRRQDPRLTQGRNPRQLMALGALHAHLAMAMRAQAASRD